MALRLLASAVRRPTATTRIARLSTTAFTRKSAIEETIPSDLEQATGVEKKELDAILAGNPDPWNLTPQKRAAGTKAEPTLVPSMFDERIVGCICEEDATGITWMKLRKGPAQRCSCGHFFQLVHGNSTAIEPDDAH